MEDAEFDPLQAIPYPGIPGEFFYVQRLIVESVDYRLLFFPLSVDSTSCRDRLEGDLGGLPDQMFEVKFTLGLDFDNPKGFRFSTPQELGLKPLCRRGMERLGEGLVNGIVRFGEAIDSQGFVAVALDDKPKLNLYYGRLLRSNEAKLIRSGYEAKSCLGGQGYALFRTSFAVSCEQPAIA